VKLKSLAQTGAARTLYSVARGAAKNVEEEIGLRTRHAPNIITIINAISIT